jgi:hypothetical protein
LLVPPDSIRVDNFLLADAAKEFEGKLYVHAGGWNYLDILAPNATRSLSIVGRFVVPWGEVEQELKCEIALEHAEAGTVLERTPIVQIVMQTQVRPDDPISLETATPFVVDIPGIGFRQPGEYAFVISHDGEELARARFQVNFVGTEPTASREPETA